MLLCCQLSQISFGFSYLFLVPFEVWEENKSNVWVWVFVDDPLCLGLLLQDVVYPLLGQNVMLKFSARREIYLHEKKSGLTCRLKL